MKISYNKNDFSYIEVFRQKIKEENPNGEKYKKEAD